MDSRTTARLAVTVTEDPLLCDGAWWPRSRLLASELVTLFQAWPPEAGLISRARYCPLDWDDAPVGVVVPKRHGRLRTGHLPPCDMHRLQLVMLDGHRRTLVVVPHHVGDATASHYLLTFGRQLGGPPAARGDRHLLR